MARKVIPMLAKVLKVNRNYWCTAKNLSNYLERKANVFNLADANVLYKAIGECFGMNIGEPGEE